MLISEPTIPKCSHGIYLCRGSENGRALYCMSCNPGRIIPDVQEVHLPRSSGDRLTTDGILQANKRQNAACPECGSMIWMRTKENGGDVFRICADCNCHYRHKVTAHEQVKQLARELCAAEAL